MWIIILRLTLGTCFLLLGVAGSLLPFLQGWFFFLLAALMFFPQHRRVESVLVRVERRMPRVASALRRMGIGREQPL
jgi:uncharacterized membrane protein YbaN (DUF454 family)